MIKPKDTHKGWFLFAPIFLDMTDEGAPGVWARHWSLEWLVTVAHWVQVALIFVLSFRAGYEPAFMFTITGKVE